MRRVPTGGCFGLSPPPAARWSPSRRGDDGEKARRRRRAGGGGIGAAAAAGAGALAPFTLFSVDLEANTTLVVAAACTALVGLLSHRAPRPGRVRDDRGRRRRRRGGARRPGYKLLVAQLSLLWCAGLGVWVVDGLQGANASIPAWLHASAWAIATGAMPLPLLSPPRFVPRFTSVYLAAATAYALFSVSYESLFYAALGFASLAWLVLERHVQKLAAADALAAGDPAPARSRPRTRWCSRRRARHAPPTRPRGTPRRSWR